VRLAGLLVLVLVLVCACNGALGLDPAVLEPDDVDNDGIAFDNCRTVENPEQVDSDADGLGDACDPCDAGDTQLFVDADRDDIDDGCDPCARGPQHDEDGDGVFDACDNCPIVATSTQADADGDGLGDACETSTTPFANTQVMFDAFSPPDPRWYALPSMPWTAEADAYRSPEPRGVLRSPDLPGVAGDHWYLELGLEIPDTRLGLEVLFDLSASGDLLSCRLDCELDRDCTVSMKSQDATNPAVSDPFIAPPGLLRMRVGRPVIAAAFPQATCELVGVAGAATLRFYDDTEFGFTIQVGDGPLHLRYAYVAR
jgi:Thrombospondin type 3 repeat